MKRLHKVLSSFILVWLASILNSAMYSFIFLLACFILLSFALAFPPASFGANASSSLVINLVNVPNFSGLVLNTSDR